MTRIGSLLLLCCSVAQGFTSLTLPQNRASTPLFSSEAVTADKAAISVDPKEAVKLFGRLADKYILLDSSGESDIGDGRKLAQFRSHFSPLLLYN
jgi:hypothetical protein